MIALAFSHLDVDTLHAIASRAESGVGARAWRSAECPKLRREMRPHRGGPAEEFLVWSIDRDAWERATEARRGLILASVVCQDSGHVPI